MFDFDELQRAGRRASFERARKGKPLPGHMRTRARSAEKQKLLLRAVMDAYRRTPPRVDHEDGRTILVLPWLL